MSDEIHVNDIGTVFRQAVTDAGSWVDLTTATSLQVCFRKPDATDVTVLATISNVSSINLFQYTVLSSAFLDQQGCWSWQGVLHFSASQRWHTNVLEFEVFPNICGTP